jgi:hypothetical protein
LLGAAFFLLGLLEKMRTDYSTLFDEQSTNDSGVSERDTDRQRVSGFLEQWGWEYNVDQCAENERIKQDEVYLDWNVIRFLNKLSYLKDKGKFLIALNGT